MLSSLLTFKERDFIIVYCGRHNQEEEKILHTCVSLVCMWILISVCLRKRKRERERGRVGWLEVFSNYRCHGYFLIYIYVCIWAVFVEDLGINELFLNAKREKLRY